VKLVYLLALLFCVSITGYSQSPSHYVLGKEELRGHDIYDILQDKAGDYWICTDNGLYRYNGYSFEAIASDEMISLSLFSLLENQKGEIFCHNLNGQIFKYHQGKLQLHYTIPKPYLYYDIYMALDMNDDLFIQANGFISLGKDTIIIRDLDSLELFAKEKINLKEARRLDDEQKKKRLELEQRLKEEKRLELEQRLKEEKRLELEQRLKEEEKINLKEERRLDDELKKKRLNGTVKWFNDAKGYGFIKRKGEEKDIFVHFSAVQNSGLKYLKEGEQLTFEVEYSDKGPSAINLQKTVNKVSRPHLKVVK